MKNRLNTIVKLAGEYLNTDENTNMSGSVESLHKLRVAVRQWLALIDPKHEMVGSFKKIIQASNKVRDLDVLLWETWAKFPKDWHAGLTSLRHNLQASRAELNTEFKAVLDDELLDELVQAQRCLVKDKHAFDLKQEHQKMPLKEIQKRLKKAVKELKILDLKDKRLHQIRLLIKRLHYQLARFYPDEKKALALSERLAKQLGVFHDLYQAINLINKHQDALSAQQISECRAFLNIQKLQSLQKMRKKL